MHSSNTSRSLGLTTIFLILLSIFNIAVGAPLPDSDERPKALAARADEPAPVLEEGPTITKEQYQAFMHQYYPENTKYILYTGNSVDQVTHFQASNPGYTYVADMVEVPLDKTTREPTVHKPYTDVFARRNADGKLVWRWEDAEAYSEAIAAEAHGEILVFGGMEYKDFPNSYFGEQELPNLKDGLNDQRLSKVKHMEYMATSADAVIATQDADGNFHYENGWAEGAVNASENPKSKTQTKPACKRDGTCAPTDSKPAESTSGKSPYGNPAEQVSHTGETTSGGHTSSSGAGDSLHRGAPATSDGGRLRGPVRIPRALRA